MVAPVAVGEFGGGEFLHEIAGLGVEDPEEGFVGEGGEFAGDAVDVVDGVAVGEAVVGLEGAGGGGGEGAGVGGPEGSAGVRNGKSALGLYYFEGVLRRGRGVEVLG